EHKKEIRKAYRKIKKLIETEYYIKKAKSLKLKENPYIDRELLEELEAIKIHFEKKFLRLDKETKKDLYKNFLIDFAYNTTSLEGNTITLDQTDKLIRENLTPKNKDLREIYDLKNTEKVFFKLLESDEEISHKTLISIHDELMENIDKRKGYRTRDTRVLRSRFDASPPEYIRIDLDILMKWHERNRKKTHPFVLAALFHQKFERIHPFADGNGRAGRILMNRMLMREGYPPTIIRKSRRGEYLDSMAVANKKDLKEENPRYFRRLIKFLAEEIISSYWNNFLI
ncbi:MAG: Fic family protein, partial [Nanoarchaeota archaeon]|nr:Fic family protein [Nanoarchaeota archaeon]